MSPSPSPGQVSDLIDTPDTVYLMLVEEKQARPRPAADRGRRTTSKKPSALKQQAKLAEAMDRRAQEKNLHPLLLKLKSRQLRMKPSRRKFNSQFANLP